MIATGLRHLASCSPGVTGKSALSATPSYSWLYWSAPVTATFSVVLVPVTSAFDSVIVLPTELPVTAVMDVPAGMPAPAIG
jgi:hypothetical protein